MEIQVGNKQHMRFGIYWKSSVSDIKASFCLCCLYLIFLSACWVSVTCEGQHETELPIYIGGTFLKA